MGALFCYLNILVHGYVFLGAPGPVESFRFKKAEQTPDIFLKAWHLNLHHPYIFPPLECHLVKPMQE